MEPKKQFLPIKLEAWAWETEVGEDPILCCESSMGAIPAHWAPSLPGQGAKKCIEAALASFMGNKL